jgi:TolB protein
MRRASWISTLNLSSIRLPDGNHRRETYGLFDRVRAITGLSAWIGCALLFAFACAILLKGMPAAGQPITMRVEAKSVARLDVCVMPFHAAKDSAFAGELPKLLRAVVDADLAYCGYFNVIEPQDLPTDTVTQIRQSGAKWDTLRLYGGSSAARVTGSITVSWNGATANIAIYQPPLKDPTYSHEFTFLTDNLRPAGHEIATWVTKVLTGEDGGFASRIVFTVRTGESKNLWVMDWDGGNPHSITQDRTINLSPTWTPDGSMIYFTTFRNGNADIYRISAGGGSATAFQTSPQMDSAPSVSPDGQWIAFTSGRAGNPEVYRCHADGSGLTQMTFSYGVDTSPSWSPTSRELVFTSDRTGVPQIYRMDMDGASVTRLTMVGNYNETARWSPRGDLIAYASREIGFQIFTIALDGTGERRVTGDGSNNDPSWSPDGMKLVYTSNQGGKSSIWTCNWDGSNARQLTFGLDAAQPQWGPASALASGR